MSISERTDRIRECAQKNGKIDENSNDDKEEIDSRSYVSGYIDDTDSGEELENDVEKEKRLNGVGVDADRDRDSAIDDSVDDCENDVIIMGLEPHNHEFAHTKNSPLDIVSTAATKSSSNGTDAATSAPRAANAYSGCRLCTLTKRYGRQIDSVFSGFILMFTTGFQIVWGLNLLYEYSGKDMPPMKFALVTVYYVGAIGGTALAVCLSSVVRKRSIHVSGRL